MQAWVIGNWKQNPATQAQAQVLAQMLSQTLLDCLDGDHRSNNDNDPTQTQLPVNLMVAPSHLHLAGVQAKLSEHNAPITLAAQDSSAFAADTGAFTGDCSARQLKDVGASWVIVGHSERRHHHQESQTQLVSKMRHAWQHQLGVIFCVGETRAQHEANQTQAVLQTQLEAINLAQYDLTDEQRCDAKLIVAYEPVWAIGTGQVASIETISQVHQSMREWLEQQKLQPALLYGGSVNADNATSLARCPNVDGVLVGGASLDATRFIPIWQAFCRAKQY